MGFLDTLTDDIRAGIAKFTAPPRPTLGALPDASSQPVKDPHFFFGQPVTTGPYVLTVGTPVEIPDPNVATAKPSRYVQIQNATGCVLNVQTGVGNFTIQGLAASTIPTDNQLPVILNPVSGYTNFSEYVKIIWLLDGQTAPMQDGSINVPYTPGTPTTSIITPVTFTGGGGGPTELLPAPSAGYTYVFYRAVFTWVSGGPGPSSFNIFNNVTIFDDPPSLLLSAASPGPVTYNPQTLAAQNAETQVIWGGSSSTVEATIELDYFIVAT